MSDQALAIFAGLGGMFGWGLADFFAKRVIDSIGELKTLLDCSDRFFGLHTLGADLEGSAMHQTLLAAYDKLFAGAVA